MKLILVFYEVSQTGSIKGPRMTSEWTQNDLRYGPPRLVPRWSRDGLPDPDIDLPTTLSHTAVSKEALFSSLLTIAERKEVSSKDWIAPPSRSQEYRMVVNSADSYQVIYLGQPSEP